jgi:hypothetical protein
LHQVWAQHQQRLQLVEGDAQPSRQLLQEFCQQAQLVCAAGQVGVVQHKLDGVVLQQHETQGITNNMSVGQLLPGSSAAKQDTSL